MAPDQFLGLVEEASQMAALTRLVLAKALDQAVVWAGGGHPWSVAVNLSFVTPMGADQRAAALVASTVGLAHSLGLRMVGEGVEDAATLDQLARLGCDQAQGYHLCRPVPADDLDRWLAERPQPVGDRLTDTNFRPIAT